MAQYIKTEEGYKEFSAVTYDKMDKTNPTGTGSFSMNRKPGTVVGANSYAEGDKTTASGENSHAEGGATTASGLNSHAEGGRTTARGGYSHTEGGDTTASQSYSHAEGNRTTASGENSHAEGYNTTASGSSSHAEGYLTTASGGYSHAEGQQPTASGSSSHAEGVSTKASGGQSHAEGSQTTASGASSHAEGKYSTASGLSSHAEGDSTNKFSSVVTTTNPTTDSITTAWKSKKFSVAKGNYSHVEGKDNLALNDGSHAEGNQTTASGQNSHAEGYQTIASKNYSHAEGNQTTASGQYSHAEGNYTKASGNGSHAEGVSTTASGSDSHAEGSYTKAPGADSHAEGSETTANGSSSHAEGYLTTASGNYSHVQGKYNIEDTSNTYADIIGNGTSNTARSNAATVDWSGNAWFAGDVYTGSTSGTNKDDGSKKLATEEYVNSSIAAGSIQPDWNQNDETKKDYIKHRPGGYIEEITEPILDIRATKQDGINKLTDVQVFEDNSMNKSSINVAIDNGSEIIHRTLTHRFIPNYIINELGADIYGNAHLIDASQPDTGEDLAMYKDDFGDSAYGIGWHIWATSIPSGDLQLVVLEETMHAIPFRSDFIPWKESPTATSVLYTAQSLTDEQQAQARANIGAGTPYTLPQATAEALGGVKADSAEAADTQPVRIGGDGKLYTAAGSTDISLGLTSAAVGQIIKVKAIDASGKPTAWEAADDKLPNPTSSDVLSVLSVGQIGEFEYGYVFKPMPNINDFISLEITSASPGQFARVKYVDDTGKPTAWEAVDIPSAVTDDHINSLIDAKLRTFQAP